MTDPWDRLDVTPGFTGEVARADAWAVVTYLQAPVPTSSELGVVVETDGVVAAVVGLPAAVVSEVDSVSSPPPQPAVTRTATNTPAPIRSHRRSAGFFTPDLIGALLSWLDPQPLAATAPAPWCHPAASPSGWHPLG